MQALRQKLFRKYDAINKFQILETCTKKIDNGGARIFKDDQVDRIYKESLRRQEHLHLYLLDYRKEWRSDLKLNY